MSYPGGKGGAGVYQTIINQMPPHDVYIEPFLGSGTILRRKRPAAIANIGIDADEGLIARTGDIAGATIIHGDAVRWLQQREHWTGRELVYCDPPYLRASRRSPSRLYRQEYGKLDHVILLAVLKRLPCMVLISGYAAPLYLKEFASWRLVTFSAMTRGGPAIEHLWCNFPEPIALHDYSYLGADFRERERIKRKAARWQQKFQALGPLEQKAVLGSLIAANDAARAAPNVAMQACIAGTGERRPSPELMLSADIARAGER